VALKVAPNLLRVGVLCGPHRPQDLSAFKAAGGKLIQYHGWSDAAIPAPSSVDYYTAVADRMGGIDQVKSFYRLFLAPGMMHCGLGPGPNAVGGVFGMPSPDHDPSAGDRRSG
jgi:hypothetical protein